MTFRPHALHLKAELFVKSSRVHVRDDGFTRCNFHLKFFIMVSRGIDISKSSFVAAYPSTNGNPTKTFPNTTAGMRELIGTLAVAEHHCVMEATSNYGCCCTCYIRTVLPSVLPPPKKKADQAFFPNDDARYQNRRKRRLHDRHVRGEDESSHLQNALAGYNTDPYHRRVYLLWQCKATIPLHRNMSNLSTIKNIRKYQRTYQPEWRWTSAIFTLYCLLDCLALQ